ncbi:MAG: hypothetical protein KBT11_06075 [Treponema sp.]|nr:hypothetical protein [Candidatus Treponema equifaecale]
MKLGEIEGQQKFAGTHFSVYNDSERNIYSITVSFMVYDSDGNNPFIGSNCVVSKIPAEIGPDETKEFVVNLDPYISIAPEEPYLIDFIYLREIHYEDGKKWTDRYGMFAAREVYE